MYDLPYRNYDAALGRFFQVDPLAVFDHDASPFAYARNNPVVFTDPSGLMVPATLEEWHAYWNYVDSGYEGSYENWVNEGPHGGSSATGSGGTGGSWVPVGEVGVKTKDYNAQGALVDSYTAIGTLETWVPGNSSSGSSGTAGTGGGSGLITSTGSSMSGGPVTGGNCPKCTYSYYDLNGNLVRKTTGNKNAVGIKALAKASEFYIDANVEAAIAVVTGEVGGLLFQGAKWAWRAYKIGKAIKAAEVISAEGAVWAQKTFSGAFSAGGKFAGKTVEEVAGMLRNGTLSAADVPINVVVRNGQTFILNTRSSAALMQAGIPRSAWKVINQTGVSSFESMLTGQLERNGLSNGTRTIRQSGTQLILSD